MIITERHWRGTCLAVEERQQQKAAELEGVGQPVEEVKHVSSPMLSCSYCQHPEHSAENLFEQKLKGKKNA